MKYLIAILLIIFQLPACKKGNDLKALPGNYILVPSTPSDVQAVLDNEEVFAKTTSLNFTSADEFYFTGPYISQLPASELGVYTWGDFSFAANENVGDWNNGFEQAYYTNVALEGVRVLEGKADKHLLMKLKGDALFKRAFAFFNLAQVFTLPYDTITADKKNGIPLRLNIDRNEPLKRGTITETYDRIIKDILEAIDLLPAEVDAQHPNRASRPAALALLSRVYLSMRSYPKALDAASRCLTLYDSLINFNTGIKAGYFPFKEKNIETLYQSKMTEERNFVAALVKAEACIDSNIVHLYVPGDLRSSVFFMQTPLGATPKGSYFGEVAPFTGLGTAEQYLIVAECNARLGYRNLALKYLNELLRHRWKTDQFTNRTADSDKEALDTILLERRKELLLRGTRWSDLKRFSMENPALILSRIVQGVNFELPAGSPRYALPIPEEAIQFNGIGQNKR